MTFLKDTLVAFNRYSFFFPKLVDNFCFVIYIYICKWHLSKFYGYLQKQPFILMFHKKMIWKFRNIHRETPVTEPFFRKIVE